ncbi:MAG: hypothetical protein RIC55_01250 [Pirellulaceae bacterium]
MFTKTKLALFSVVALGAIAVATQIQASPLSGSWCRASTVYAGNYQNYTEYFRAGERAVIELQGDGDTDLDVYVYDEYGNLIVSDTAWGDYAAVSFVPSWSGRFTIKVVNRGHVYNNYTICMY